jgi:hypothetical protein
MLYKFLFFLCVHCAVHVVSFLNSIP